MTPVARVRNTGLCLLQPRQTCDGPDSSAAVVTRICISRRLCRRFGPAVSRDGYSASLVSLLPNSALSGYPGQISMGESWMSIWTPKMLYNLHRQAVLREAI